MTRLLLVRHALAGDRAGWMADDRRRPLSRDGFEQSRGLVGRLAGRTVTRILSSPYDRCIQTVQPLAEARDLDVEPHPDLVEHVPHRQLRDLLRESADGTVLCTHGDVIGDLIGELRLRGVDVGDDPRWEKASTWVLELDGRDVTAASYLPPPS